MRYDPLTRLLHVTIAIGITVQMLVSLVMVYPKPGRLPNEWFAIHETLGVVLCGVLATHWLWSVLRTLVSGEPMRLFPWFSRSRLSELADDIRATVRELGRLRLPNGEGTEAFPAVVQGLGLLLGLFLAGSGTILALGMAPDGTMSSLVHAIKEAHETAAPLMWVYLAAHPTLGILHHLAGHKTLDRVFGFGGRSNQQ
ncbi:cytochrome b/b6 domain-containing protein [Telmatospirillum sp.]|uniref:cytochrome b/b6 domain-containing protein n=1 Tax=Telmatospirillum sp. TaxID=2079197 RepID=UPI002843E0C7|nr:cytochrome b/b6 domain-containing protein [Telmatospirillum sp.]MDR3438652.1 cytochrome b/b6 domain-containing protein [Telmatospirillum sp.]